MKGRKRIVRALMLLALVPSAAMAEVPHRFNLQSIVYDSEGNVTASEKVNVSVRIVDEDGNAVWEETHDGVVVVEGAINVVIGETNPLQPEVLNPTEGVKFIDVQVEGHNPFELLPLGAVPYAMWSEKALTVADDSIGSDQIINGSIKVEDLNPIEFSDITGTATEGQIPGSIATDAELNAHIGSGTAHNASAIVVSGPFITMVAGNAQEGFRKLDGKLADEIVNRQSGQATLTTNLNNEIAARVAGDANDLTTATTFGGDVSGMYNAIVVSDDSHNHSGSTITDGTITSDDIQNGSISTTDIDTSSFDSRYVNTGGDTMTGALSVPDQPTGPVLDGAGNFNVGRTLRRHEDRIFALEQLGTSSEGSQSIGGAGTYEVVVKSVDTGQVTGTINCDPGRPYLASVWLSFDKPTNSGMPSTPSVTWNLKTAPYSVNGGTVSCRTMIVATVASSGGVSNMVLRWRHTEL